MKYMHGNKVAISCILFVVLVNCGQQARAAWVEFSEVRTFTKAEVKGTPYVNEHFFEFSTSSGSYKILGSGKGRRVSDTFPTRSFNLRLDDGFRLEHIYFAEYQSDLLLICEITNEVDGAGFITRLDGRNLRTKWKGEIFGFNVGQGIIEHEHAYVTGIGFVGKVNLASGAYVWRHDDLYKGGTFNSFELPEVKETTVLFRESKDYLRQRVATVEIEKQSGKIVSINR